jgi:hypothetical protein
MITGAIIYGHLDTSSTSAPHPDNSNTEKLASANDFINILYNTIA